MIPAGSSLAFKNFKAMKVSATLGGSARIGVTSDVLKDFSGRDPKAVELELEHYNDTHMKFLSFFWTYNSTWEIYSFLGHQLWIKSMLIIRCKHTAKPSSSSRHRHRSSN